MASAFSVCGIKIALMLCRKARPPHLQHPLKEASVKKIDRMREKVSILPTSVYLSKMHDAGWSLVALEWEREVETSAQAEEQEAPSAAEEIPFGLRIASDCRHLEDDPLEMQTLKSLAEMIVQDVSFTSMADALNVREYRTRDGRPWTAAGVFKLTPRLIDVAPRVLSGAQWESRKKQLSRVTWNS
ncbi:MAG: hypothetical protein AUF67_00725 [Acidobacteria bacterium 13_1_20CM_58_21]|nr:MAG: hypothetical protein AUF67_00725 [Acidobacteria bacterium 13_1_20CM_58_21]